MKNKAKLQLKLQEIDILVEEDQHSFVLNTNIILYVI